MANTVDYYTINTDDLDIPIDDIPNFGCHDNQSLSSVPACLPGQHSIVTRIPSENCEIRELSKEEISESTEKYSDVAFSRKMSSNQSVHNSLYPCTDEADQRINTGSIEVPRRKLSENRISSSSDDVFTTCKSCSQILSADLTCDEPEMIQCSDCGRLNIRISPVDIHVSERTDSAIGSTASDDSDQSHSIKSGSSASSDEYLMPESPGIAVSTKTLLEESNLEMMDVKDKSFIFSDSADLQKNGSEDMDDYSAEMATQLQFFRADASEYYYILRHRVESVLLKRQLSGKESWAIASTKL